tara:strand:- start:1021 stop:1239 length:219 start_codon:yes stop_codon:yes gene_type:complete
MSAKVFAVNIKAVLEDGTEVTDVKGFVIDDKRVYKLSDNTVLTGTKKIKTFKFARFVVPPEILPFIMCKEYE